MESEWLLAENAFRKCSHRPCQGRVVMTQAWEVFGSETEVGGSPGARAVAAPAPVSSSQAESCCLRSLANLTPEAENQNGVGCYDNVVTLGRTLVCLAVYTRYGLSSTKMQICKGHQGHWASPFTPHVQPRRHTQAAFLERDCLHFVKNSNHILNPRRTAHF